MITRTVLLTLVLMLSGISAWAQDGYVTQPINPDDMHRCRSFADCTLVWGGCSDAAINKAYVNQFKPAPACAASAPHDPKAMPTCTNGMCVVAAPDEKK